MGKDVSGLEQLHVLIVEDDLSTRAIIREVLRSHNVGEIANAANGAEGLAKLETFDADVVICDWNMPGMDGLEFCRRVRSHDNDRIHFLPIIMLTANRSAEDVMSARDAGVNEFLGKPFAAEDLLKRVAVAVRQPRPFIQADTYFGPNRRRTRPNPGQRAPKRRKDDA